MDTYPNWLQDLEEDELIFMKKFVLASGSLKEMAGQYNVTYPTVRLRLDRLIQKIEAKERGEADPYVNLLRQMTVEGKMSPETSKILIAQYRKQINGF